MIYVNDKVFKERSEDLLIQIAKYIKGLPEVDSISVAVKNL